MLGPALGWCGDHPSTLKNRSMPPGDAGRRGWRCGADCHRGYLARVHNRVVGKAALRQQDAIRPTFDAHIRDVDRLCARILEGDHSPERGVPWRAAKPAAQQSSSRRRPGRALPGGTAAPQRTPGGTSRASRPMDGALVTLPVLSPGQRSGQYCGQSSRASSPTRRSSSAASARMPLPVAALLALGLEEVELLRGSAPG